jgi:plastocyanin
MRSLHLVILALAAIAIAAACSPSAGTPAPSGPPADVTITANNLEFGETSVEAPAGRAFTIDFNNLESAPHNVSIGRDNSFSSFLFQGEVVQSRLIRYDVPALQPGTYPFRCDLHPEMLGTIVAK